MSKKSMRYILNLLLESGSRTNNKRINKLSFIIDIVIMVSIVLSCVLIILDYSFPDQRSLWLKFEVFFAIFFLIEYLLRWYASIDRIRYPFTFYALIDLAANLPSLLLLTNNFMALRLLRFARFLRLLKLLRYNYYLYNSLNNLKNRFSALRDEYQLDHLGSLFFLSVIALITGANLLYFTETEFASELSPYSSYWESYWNIIIVLISGIEDKEPHSLPGKIEVTLLLIAGICVVGMVTAEIVSILVGKFNSKGRPALKPLNSKMENHIVILGFNKHLDYVIRQVYRAFAGRYYILVVCNNLNDLRVTIPHVYKMVVVVEGDPLQPEILKKADIEDAKRIIVLSQEKSDYELTDIDNKTLMKTIAASSFNPLIPITTQLEESSTLKYTGVIDNTDFILSSGYMEKLISQGVLNPGVTEIYRSLMTFSCDSNEFYKVMVTKEFGAKTFTQIGKWFLEKGLDVIPVGVCLGGKEKGGYSYKINPIYKNGGDFLVNPGDCLVVIAYEKPEFSQVKKSYFSIKDNFKKSEELRLLKESSDLSSYNLSENSSFKDLKNSSVIICNANKNLKNIVEEILYDSKKEPFNITLIVNNKQLWTDNPKWHPNVDKSRFKVIFGDPSKLHVLEEAGVRDCGAAVILANPEYGELSDAPSALIALAIERINPEIHTIMELINSVNREYIDSGVINEVVCLGDITEKLIAQNCFHSGVINIFDDLLTSGKGTPQIYLPEICDKLMGKKYIDIYISMLEKVKDFIVIGFIKEDNFIINPNSGSESGKETVLYKGDRLIVIAHGSLDMNI